MNLYLLEVTYAAQDRKTVEPWLSQANLGCVLLSSEQYNDEILTVLASNQALVETSKKLCQHPAISSCEEKRRDIYRIATWLGDDVRVVQRHYAKLRPDDREIMRAFTV